MVADGADRDPLLQAEALTRTFGAVHAVRELSLRVQAGEVVGLLGPNGAGKTTTLRMLAGILTPTSGQASVCGHDTVREALAAKRKLGFLSGDTALYQRLTPREILTFFGRLHELPAARIVERTEEIVGLLRMTDFADRPCGTLSSGQQQKANIARTLLHDPPVLILDEPTASLDIVTGQFILSAIKQARSAGKAVLFSTHIMGEAEYLCDRIMLIHAGKVQAEGTLEELRATHEQHSLTDIFLGIIGEHE
jgi:sodium transport system ATP-binding protein